MRALALSFVIAVSACAHAAAERADGFVDAARIVPGLRVEMRYAGAHNFVGRRVDGYEAPVCLLTHEAAEALAGVQAELAASGLGLKVFDCYRPQRAVADLRAGRPISAIRARRRSFIRTSIRRGCSSLATSPNAPGTRAARRWI